MVLQDTWLFEGTIRENLTYGKKIPDSELMDICKQCGLGHRHSREINGKRRIICRTV